MMFAPVRLGETVIEPETLAADKKSCKRFGPCGVGEKALYLNSFLIDRRCYVALSSVQRVFKRVALSKGGFSGQGVFGSIPYLVVQYDNGQEKQCTFKREEDVDEMLACISAAHPEIPTLSVGGEQRLQAKAEQEAKRYCKELSPQALSARETLEQAETFLSGYPEMTKTLALAAKAKRVNEHTNPAYRWVALAIVLAGAASLIYGIISWRSGGDFGVYFALFGFAAVFFFSGTCCPRRKTTAARSSARGRRRSMRWKTSCPRISRCPRATRTPSWQGAWSASCARAAPRALRRRWTCSSPISRRSMPTCRSSRRNTTRSWLLSPCSS